MKKVSIGAALAAAGAGDHDSLDAAIHSAGRAVIHPARVTLR
jgi:hypothetical protein